MLETAIETISTQPGDAPNEVWVEALPARVYPTPQYGEVAISVEKLQRMIHNFKENVRGQEIATDFDHGLDRAKGNKASGWFRDFAIRPSSSDPNVSALWSKVELTEEAQREISDSQWKYFSLEWDDAWDSTHDGQTYNDVIMGGGFTNRPIAKHTLPVNFSESMWQELDDDTKREFAVWSTAYVNSLPNSSFLYIDSSGGRHLPYKDKSGKIDLPHLRNAIARANQVKGISADTVARIIARARKMLGNANKAMAEGGVALQLFDDMIFETEPMTDESKEWEHSEPGLGTVTPRTDEDGSDEPDRIGGWRRQTPPIVEEIESQEGKVNKLSDLVSDKNVHELQRVLDLDVESDGDKIVETVKIKFGELASLREAVDAADQEKIFAEQYPQYWQEHRKLMERDRENSARTFSESVKSIREQKGYGLIETKQGLSSLAQDKIIEVHKK